MKPFIFLLLPILLFVSNMDLRAQQKHIPELEFRDTENNFFTSKDIPEGSALMLVYFRTDCDECRHMAQTLSQHAEEYPLTIWMISPNDLEALSTFEYMTGLLSKTNIHILQDNQKRMHTWFSFKSLPFVLLFDKSGNQVASYESLPDAKTVIDKLTIQATGNR